MAATENKVPDWIKAELFEKLLQENEKDFVKILEFKAFPAVAAGENYATIMLRVEIQMQLNGKWYMWAKSIKFIYI